MKRILFVDDEPQVLDGLQNLLHRRRREWNMVFANGGQAGLDELAKVPFDVVVSDMRMPGMDGPTFLTKVKEAYPTVVRIGLSGHAEREMVIQALRVSHQFLTKPADADTLCGVIERTLALSALLDDPVLLEIVGRLERLPSVPETYRQLSQILDDPNADARAITEILERDPAVCVKLLQLANSAYFGSSQPTQSISQAVQILGTELLKALALTAHMFNAQEDAKPIPGYSVQQAQHHAIMTARLAKRFAAETIHRDEAFLLGLVHDIGGVVLALGVPERYTEVLRTASETGRPHHVIEKEVLGVTHAQVGAYLLGLWGLPFSMVEAVAYHHSPTQATGGSSEMVVTIYAADAFAHQTHDDAESHEGASGPDPALLDSMGMAHRLADWQAIADDLRRELKSAA